MTTQLIFLYMIFIQITSNNSGCVPSVGSWVEPTLSHVILQLMIVLWGPNISWEFLTVDPPKNKSSAVMPSSVITVSVAPPSIVE